MRGGYSYLKKGANPVRLEEARRPLQSRVYFAGEAFHPDAHMTLHQAMLSGEMTAKQVLENF